MLAAADGTPQASGSASWRGACSSTRSSPSHVDRWFEVGGDALRARGVDVDEIVEELPAMVETWQPYGAAIATRFARAGRVDLARASPP